MISHIRKRYLLLNIKEKLKFTPVVIIQGARQTGKSFLVKKLLAESGIDLVYKTLDSQNDKYFAQTNPDTFLRQVEPGQLFAIDEAQKAPGLFDSVKLSVDENRRPGQFILLGSSEFSKLNLVKESLTGRATKLKLHPFLLAEAKHLSLNREKNYLFRSPRVSRHDLIKFLNNGGMPGIFGIRNEQNRFELLSDWINLTCERDALDFKTIKVESDLLRRILIQVAELEEPSFKNICSAVKIDSRKVKKHLEVLKTLFVLNEIAPLEKSTGTYQYYFMDVGVLNNYNCTFHKKLKTWVLQELTALITYRNEFKRQIYFYRTSKAQMIDFIIKENSNIVSLFKIYSEEHLTNKNFELIRSFKQKFKKNIGNTENCIALTAHATKTKFEDISAWPWESIV